MPQRFSRSPLYRLTSIAACSLVAACAGTIEKRGSSDDGPTDDGGAGGGGAVGGRGGAGGALVPPPPDELPAITGDPDAAGPMPLRRLTRLEYDYTVRDLLGDDSRPAAAFPDEPTGPSGFVSPIPVTGVETTRYRDAAEALAARAATQVDTLAPCPANANQETCASELIARFGRRAFRRPLDATEKELLLAVYKANRAAPISEDHRGAIRVVLQAMLQAPQFLYHWELGPAAATKRGDVIALNDHEIASRLSYFLWASMPDDALFAAADAGKLSDPAEVEKQARRMLADPKAEAAIAGFFVQVLELAKLPTVVKDTRVYPAWSAPLAEAYLDEVAAFSSHAVLEDGALSTLLTARTSFVNETLAKVYGAPGVSGAELREATLPPSRPGLLTRGAFLATHANTFETSPVLRGKLVLTRFLCEEVPPPPDGADTKLAPPSANQQTRERFTEHSKNEACASCHTRMDALGFAFEGYDGIGASRAQDAGRDVDASGRLDLDGKTIAFRDATELLPALAVSHTARTCAARQFLRYGFGRPEVDADERSLTTAVRRFAESGWHLPSLLVSLTTTKSFLFRSPSEGEVLR